MARYGNEAFEQTLPGELTALSCLVSACAARVSVTAGGGLRVLRLNRPPISGAMPQKLWQHRDIGRITA